MMKDDILYSEKYKKGFSDITGLFFCSKKCKKKYYKKLRKKMKKFFFNYKNIFNSKPCPIIEKFARDIIYMK